MASEDALPSVFVDSNVLFSAVHSSAGAPAKILALHGKGLITLVISRQVAEELVRNLRGKAPLGVPVLLTLFQTGPPRLAEDPYEGDVNSLIREGVNPHDAPIVAAAIGADVDYFVTGDRRLRNELAAVDVRFQVVSPRKLVEDLQK